jgi:hypothetical protein
VELHTKLGSGNGIELGIRLNGFHGSDRIKVRGIYKNDNFVDISEYIFWFYLLVIFYRKVYYVIQKDSMHIYNL